MVAWPWVAPVTLAQAQTLVVEGQLTNATPGGGAVAGVRIVFHQESASAHRDLETAADPEGRFRFEGIVFDPDFAYGVSAHYQGATYGMDIDLSGGSPFPIVLTVYDAVSSDEVLSASTASVLFASVDKASQTIVALEIVKIANGSDRTYVPGPEPMKLLRFGLPPGAEGLQVDTPLPGADFAQVDRGFALLASVPPGEHEVMFTYRFPYSARAASFAKSFAYGVGHLRVLAPNEVLTLSSSQLGTPQAITIGQRAYQLLEASDLPRDARISIDLAGLPQASLSDRIGQRLKGMRAEYVAPASLSVLMVIVIGYALWRRGRDRRQGVAGGLDPISSEDERHTLGRMLAELDDSFQAGGLPEEEYQRRRTVLGRRLASLTRS